ncbi:hypothetical protein L7F22_057387 [Adiantum nelumboides]|nr:hypothetical protein [Adiantum nelumboides]
MHFQKSARQWWASLQANGEAPKTWNAIGASIMKQFLASNAKDKVLTKWRSLKLSLYESIHKYVDKFWDLHLKATVYKKIDFEEQKQKFCAGLREEMNEYVNFQRPKSISMVIHHTMVAARINFQQGAKRNLKPMEAKDKQEYKRKKLSQNSSKGNSNNNKAKQKGVFKGKNKLTPKELEHYRKENKCFKCEEQGHSYHSCPQRNTRNEQPRASMVEAPKEEVHCKGYFLSYAWGKVREHDAFILFDPSSTHNFISLELAAKLGVQYSEMGDAMKSSFSAYIISVKDSLNGVNETQINESGMQEDLELSNFLNQFQDVFIDDIPGELPPKSGDDDHMIELIPGSSLPNKPPYRISQAQQEEIMRQVNELVKKGMVRPSSSQFCSLVLLVQKKDDIYPLEYPRLSKFFFSAEELHEEYGLSLEGKLPKELSDKDIPDEEWLSVFKCLHKKNIKLFLNHVRDEFVDELSDSIGHRIAWARFGGSVLENCKMQKGGLERKINKFRTDYGLTGVIQIEASICDGGLSSILTMSASKLQPFQAVETPMYIQLVLSMADGLSDQENEQKRELDQLNKELEVLKASPNSDPRKVDCKEVEVMAITKMLSRAGATIDLGWLKEDLDSLQVSLLLRVPLEVLGDKFKLP